MKIIFLTVKTSHEDWSEVSTEKYIKKISQFFPCSHLEIKSKKISADKKKQKVSDESERILKSLEPNDFVVACDEKGHLFKDSHKFSEFLVKSVESGSRRLVFIIGGAYGLSADVKKRANKMMSLSGMTMNHFVARLVLMEQVYRGLSIWKGLPYHND